MKVETMSIKELHNKLDEVEMYLEDEDLILDDTDLHKTLSNSRAVLNAEIERRFKQ